MQVGEIQSEYEESREVLEKLEKNISQFSSEVSKHGEGSRSFRRRCFEVKPPRLDRLSTLTDAVENS
jgi:predicted nuclease with TOPRIM domain